MEKTPAKVKRQHKDRTLKEKIEILRKLKSGTKAADLCRQYGISQSTLSTWKKNEAKLQELVDDGRVLETKRNRVCFLPQVERSLHHWFIRLRKSKDPPPMSTALLIAQATK